MCTSLEFNEFFGSSFDVPCFVFSSFVVQFSRYRLLPLFATACIVYHTQFRLSRGFQNFFRFLFDIFVCSKSQFLASFRVLPVFLVSRAPAPLRSFIILPLSSPFVNPFLHFFPLFSAFLPFLFDVSRFFPFFLRLRGGTCLCSLSKFQSMVRGVDLSRYEFEKIFCIHNFMSADNTSRNQVLPTGVGIRQKPWLGKD